MVNVALLSRWHVHADDYANEVKKNDQLLIKVVWDEDPKRGKRWAEELNVPFEADLQKVLTNPEIDAVVVNTPTNLHKEVITSAANHKKHIFTEKVLAFTEEDCNEIYNAVEENGVRMVVSLPRLTANYYLYAQKVLDDGLLGKITTIRCRLAHNGAVIEKNKSHGWLPERFFDEEQCGGGALIDLGAHPIYLTNRLGGKVQALNACLKQTNDLGVDDNATVLLEYESGALGIIETGFLSQGSPFQLELYGTEGTLLIEDDQIRLKSNQLDKFEWIEPKEELKTLPMPMKQWVSAIVEGITPTITKSDVINLTIINEAAAKSNAMGCRVQL
jgi:predicted dehydrogenase